MTKDIWEERRRGLEAEFFVKHNRELLDKLRAKQHRENATQDLERALGVHDPDVLGKLVNLGVTPSTAAALSLIPLITVAWSDHKLDEAERDAILKAVSEDGITQGSPAFDLLTLWLGQEPKPSLFEAWVQYIKALKAAMAPSSFAKLSAEIIGRARRVATATGGILGLGQKISEEERQELDRLALAFA